MKLYQVQQNMFKMLFKRKVKKEIDYDELIEKKLKELTPSKFEIKGTQIYYEGKVNYENLSYYIYTSGLIYKSFGLYNKKPRFFCITSNDFSEYDDLEEAIEDLVANLELYIDIEKSKIQNRIKKLKSIKDLLKTTNIFIDIDKFEEQELRFISEDK